MIPRFESWFFSIVLKDIIHKNILYKSSVYGFPFIKKIILTVSLKTELMKRFGPLPVLVLLFILTGDKGLLCKAKKSISNWKLRKGVPFACKVILANNKSIFYFLEELVNVVLPQLKNYAGFKILEDQSGVFSFGLSNIFLFSRLISCKPLWLNLCKGDNKLALLGLNITFIFNFIGFFLKSFFLSCFQVPCL